MYKGKEVFVKMLMYSYIIGFVNDKIYKKFFFIENNILFFKGKYYEDLGINYKFFFLVNRVYVIN